jgi:nitrogen-specific signal transduction histidine kinase
MDSINSALDLKKGMDNLPVAVIVIDQNRVIVHANKIASEYSKKPTGEIIGAYSGKAFDCSHSKEDVRGCGFGDFCSKECFLQSTVLDSFKDKKERKMIEGSLPYLNKTGERSLRVSTIPFSINAEDFLLLCIEDLTDLKEAQKQKLAKAKLETLIETAGGMCHELNQPLQAALGYAELLLSKVDPQSGCNELMLLKLKDQILRISVIVNNILNIDEYRTRNYINDEKIINFDKNTA